MMTSPPTPPAINRAVDYLRAAQRIVVLTGAGVSKESGIPTFRDALDGLWARYNPTELATPQAFAAAPKLVWDFYQFRRELMRPAVPNPGHVALAALERLRPQMTIITQNIDDLHEQAGSRQIIRLHGRISANKCSADCLGDPTPVDVSLLTWDAATEVPRCPHCGAFVRPDVVWFSEELPAAALDAAFDRCKSAEVTLVIGTSGLVSPAAHLPTVARAAGAVVIEVNPIASAITPIADVWIAAASGVALPEIVALLEADDA